MKFCLCSVSSLLRNILLCTIWISNISSENITSHFSFLSSESQYENIARQNWATFMDIYHYEMLMAERRASYIFMPSNERLLLL